MPIPNALSPMLKCAGSTTSISVPQPITCNATITADIDAARSHSLGVNAACSSLTPSAPHADQRDRHFGRRRAAVHADKLSDLGWFTSAGQHRNVGRKGDDDIADARQ